MKKENNDIENDNRELFTEQFITDTLEENYMPYAMSVIISRALPEIDGFKPSHRKLLYTMYKKGLLTGPRTKSANVVGETMKLNPHGDQAIYETMVRLTRDNETLLHPYVDSKGNFGKRYSRDMAFAAPRYTEVKLEKICEELFADIDKDTVDFVDNYDGTMKEPTLLPVTFPTLLVNSTEGLAVSMATKICSFNLSEVCDATCAYIDDPKVNLLDYIKAPDFSTGGYVIYKEKEMENIIENGAGSIKIRAKYRYDKKNSCIEVYEIPYTTTLEDVIDGITEIVKEGKIKDITDVRDELDLNGLKIAIDIRKTADPDSIMNKLFALTSLEQSFGCNFNVIVNGRPEVLGVRGIIDEWLKFRTTCVERKLKTEIRQKEERLHLLKGLEKILLDIDKAIKIIRETESDDLIIPNLMWGFSINEVQAEFIAEIKLRNLNKEYIIKRIDEKNSLIDSIAELKGILGSRKKLNELIKKQLREVSKKYGKPRKTDIMLEEEVVKVTKEEMIEDYKLKLFLTRDSYLKKITLVSLRSSGDQKLKEGDEIIQEVETHNKTEIMFISSKSNVYKMKVYDLPDCKASALGEYLGNTLGMDQDENIVYFVLPEDYEGWMLYAFENGKVAKVPLKAYETKTNRKKLINAYSDKSPLVNALYTPQEAEIALSSSNDRIIIINSKYIPEKPTKTSQGVQVMKLKRDYKLKYMKFAADAGFVNPRAYSIRNIPVAGAFIKDSDKPVEQLSMDLGDDADGNEEK